MGSLLTMKLALVCLLASQALTAPSSSKDMDMRAASCKCGVQGGANRIVGGIEAKVNEFPWIASMSLNFGGMVSDHMCGGTLVSAEWIVTAAHCLGQTEKLPSPRIFSFKSIRYFWK